MSSVHITTSLTCFLYTGIAAVGPSVLPGLSVLGSTAGSPLTLECIIESYPKSFVVWSFEGDNYIDFISLVLLLMSAPDKILHSEGGGGGHRITELPLSMYRISSKLTLTNYTQDQAGVYTYDELHFLTDQ